MQGAELRDQLRDHVVQFLPRADPWQQRLVALAHHLPVVAIHAGVPEVILKRERERERERERTNSRTAISVIQTDCCSHE